MEDHSVVSCECEVAYMEDHSVVSCVRQLAWRTYDTNAPQRDLRFVNVFQQTG